MTGMSFEDFCEGTPDNASALPDGMDAEILQKLVKAGREEALFQAAETDFLTFARLMSPHRTAPKDVFQSAYQTPAHIRLIAEALERVEKGTLHRLIVAMPPRHGKSESVTRLFPAWAMGKDPTREFIITGYSQKFAEKSFGKKIRNIVESERYARVFPDISFDVSKASDAMQLSTGGQFVISGRMGALTGHGAHIAIIDDPVKGEKETDSEVTMDDIWEWFCSTLWTRVYPGGAIIIVMTRWSEDDLVARLTNPDHPDYRPDIAKLWTILHLPAHFEQHHEPMAKVLGKKVGDYLWPEGGFGEEFCNSIRALSDRTWTALYQGEPSPPEGDHFKAQWLQEYRMKDLPPPEKLRFYGASDHGVSMRTRADPSVLGVVGVDEHKNIWVMPDLTWQRMTTDQIVDELVAKMKYHKPAVWWLEQENISRAFGPFLTERMIRDNVFHTVLDPRPASRDKVTRSQAVRGLMAARRIYFPAEAKWWPAAKKQILTFPNGAAFDFVDWLAWIGQGVMEMLPADRTSSAELPSHRIPGTMAWLKHQSAAQEKRKAGAARRRYGY